MSMKVYGSKFKPASAVPAGTTPEAMAAAEAAVLADRERQIQENKFAQLQRDNEALKKSVSDANAERDATMVKNAILSVASAAKATNPEHVYRLHAADFVVHNGKVVSKVDPTKEPAAVLGEFFKGDGMYLLGTSVPAGSGAPAVQGVIQKPAVRIDTNEGLTAVTRGITNRMFSPHPALSQPAAQVAANTAPQGQQVPPAK